jgi:hypothetical protein
MRRAIAMLVLGPLVVAATAKADDKRDPDASLGAIFHGPFQSSRLFAMPTADVVGAYMLSLSGDGSLLQQPGALTFAGVLAVGFGDIAQLEYRHTSAISVTGINAPVPAVGVQLRVPIPERPFVPALGVAFRLGVPRAEYFGATEVDETVTDLYVVARERLGTQLVLHGGLRISSAKITLTGDPMRPGGSFSGDRRLYLPTAGFELLANRDARVVAEVSAAPQFAWMQGTSIDPAISYGLLGRLGLRWALLPSVIFDASLGYQMDVPNAGLDRALGGGPRDIVQEWDIRLGAEVFVPWGALACRALGVFCD